MAEFPLSAAPVFPLGSTSKLQNGDDLTRIAPSVINGLPSRTKMDMRTTIDAKLPLSDQTLTGKQEHCEWALPAPDGHRGKPNRSKISSENSSRSRSYSKSQTWHLQRRYSGLAHPSDQNLER